MLAIRSVDEASHATTSGIKVAAHIERNRARSIAIPTLRNRDRLNARVVPTDEIRRGETDTRNARTPIPAETTGGNAGEAKWRPITVDRPRTELLLPAQHFIDRRLEAKLEQRGTCAKFVGNARLERHKRTHVHAQRNTAEYDLAGSVDRSNAQRAMATL